jgi:hypothetical protein
LDFISPSRYPGIEAEYKYRVQTITRSKLKQILNSEGKNKAFEESEKIEIKPFKSSEIKTP